MAAIRYMVIRRVDDVQVASTIMDASEGRERIGVEELKSHLQRVAGDSDLVKVVCVDIKNTPADALERAWRNSVAYPITPDGTISFEDAYFALPKKE